MKNLKYVMLLLLVIFMTGCGNQKLTCTQIEEDDDGTYTNEVVLQFKKDTIKDMQMTIQTKFTDADNWELAKSYMEEYSESETGYSFKSTIDDDNQTYKITINVDYTTISADYLEELGYNDLSQDTYDDVKAELEDDGYTCK